MKLDGKLLLVVRESKKDSSKTYCALCVDLGYALKYLTFDSRVISEVLGLYVRELFELEVGEYEVEI